MPNFMPLFCLNGNDNGTDLTVGMKRHTNGCKTAQQVIDNIERWGTQQIVIGTEVALEYLRLRGDLDDAHVSIILIGTREEAEDRSVFAVADRIKPDTVFILCGDRQSDIAGLDATVYDSTVEFRKWAAKQEA